MKQNRAVRFLYALSSLASDLSHRLGRMGSALSRRLLERQPIDQRLIYAAHARCPCGAGMAYDPGGESGKPFGYWDCSAILLQTADPNVTHEARLPFAFYEIKSENQPSAYGSTTRPGGRQPAAAG